MEQQFTPPNVPKLLGLVKGNSVGQQVQPVPNIPIKNPVSGFEAPAFPNKKKPELEVLQEVEEEVV